MSQEGQEYVCAGGLCRCDKGTLPVPLQVSSNQSVWLQNKLVATTLDKTFAPFGTCALKNNQPCVPALLLWEDVHETVGIGKGGGHPLLEKSTIRCGVGGVVSVLTTLQIAVPATPSPAQAGAVHAALAGLYPLLLNETPAENEAENDPTAPQPLLD